MALEDIENKEKDLGKPNRVQGFFPTRDGTQLFYQVEGEGNPLVFCYGLLCQRDHWRHQIAHFRNRYQIITFDYRGHQASGRPRNDRHLSLDWCARDLQDLLRYLNLSRVVLLGHSMGVPVLNELAQIESERVAGAIWVCGSVSNPFKSMFFTDRMDQVYRGFRHLHENSPIAARWLWQQLTRRSKLGYFLTANFGFNPDRAEERDVLMYLHGVNETPLETFQGLLRDYTAYDGREKLGQVSWPVLVVAGDQDWITPLALQEEMLERLPNARLVTVPEGSHNAHMDEPAIVNEAITQFLQERAF